MDTRISVIRSLAMRSVLVGIALAAPIRFDLRDGVVVNDASCGEGTKSTLCCPAPGHLCVALPLPVEDYEYDVLPWPGCIG